MPSLSDLTIRSLREGLMKKKFSAREIAEAYVRAIQEKDPEIRAYLHVREEQAFAEADGVDRMIAAGDALGPLAGVPLAVKDNMLLEGEVTTAGSRILETYRGSYTATAVARARSADAVILGKTNLDEFAMGTSTENSAFFPTKNPRDPARVPGGSSGGSAAAVAADMALAALGSDTGGSIRQPASFCGVVGIKPTYGRVSRFGLIAMASSLDQIGALAKNVSDAHEILNAIQGYDPQDATSAPDRETARNLPTKEAKHIAVGIPREYFPEGLNMEVSDAVMGTVQTLREEGIKIKEVSLPHMRYALSAYYIIVPAEISANLSRFDGIRYARGERAGNASNLQEIYFAQRALFGAEPKRRIILGAFVLSSGYYDAYYAKAQRVRELVRQDFADAFKEVDVLLGPVAPNPPFKIGEKANDPLALYLEDVFTLPVNLAGLPALAIPTAVQKPLPIGFQLIGNHFREDQLFCLGKFYEKIVSRI